VVRNGHARSFSVSTVSHAASIASVSLGSIAFTHVGLAVKGSE
jgi:hypothetical protein